MNYFYFFANKLRLGKPWKYKVPLIMAFTYFFVLTGNVSHQEFLYSFIAAVTTTVGFAGIGYWTNDLSDIRKDGLAGKENSLANLPNLFVLLIGTVFILLAIAPWFYLPFDKLSITLLGIEFILFFVYAFPPFRFKEKGFLGLIIDALYAHVVPALLASWTFYLVGGASYNLIIEFGIALGCWQLISGIRNILSHQLKDFENDQKSDTTTWVVKKGKKVAERLMNSFLIPAEIITFIVFLVFVQVEIIYLAPIAIIFILISLRRFKKAKYDLQESVRKHFTNIFLDDFYIKWLPLLILSGLIFVETEVRWVLLFHLILFYRYKQNALTVAIQKILKKYINTRLINRLFSVSNYYKGFGLHLMVLLVYLSFFVLGYFVLQYFIVDDYSFMKIQGIWSKFLILILLLHAVSFFIFRKDQSVRALKEFVFEKGTAYNLAIFRIIFFFIMAGSYSTDVFGRFLDWTYLPESAKVGLPYIGWIIDLLPVTPEIYKTMGVIGFILALTGLLGFQTKWTLKLYIPVALYLWGVPCFYGKLNHHHIMVWIPIIFAFSRCSDVLSLDALVRRLRNKWKPPEKSIIYGFPLVLIWIHLGMIYCFSGLHKLWDTGLYWALSDNIVNQIRLEWIENYDTVSAFRADNYPWLLRIGAVGVIVFEIIYPVFLLKPLTRVVNFIGAWMLHLTAGYFLNIDFVILRITHVSLVNWDKLKFWRSLNKMPFLPNSNEYCETPNWHILKKMSLFYVGSFLVAGNMLFGIMGVSSWPLSAYPAYSGIVKNEVDLIRMDASDNAGNFVDVKKIGKEAGFRWENIRPFEERISETLAKNDTLELQKKLETYWRLWNTKVRGLSEVNHIDMYLETTTLIPEDRDKIIRSVYLGRVTPEKQR